ncbi:hypothetical protein Tco_0215566 [Tanacetum coccineum]
MERKSSNNGVPSEGIGFVDTIGKKLWFTLPIDEDDDHDEYELAMEDMLMTHLHFYEYVLKVLKLSNENNRALLPSLASSEYRLRATDSREHKNKTYISLST